MTPEEATRLMELLEAAHLNLNAIGMALMGILILDFIRTMRGK